MSLKALRIALYLVPLTLIVINGICYNFVQGEINPKSVLLQSSINLLFITLFTIMLSVLNNQLISLEKLSESISLSLLDPNSNSIQILQLVKRYYERGGDDSFELNELTVHNFSYSDIANFTSKVTNSEFKSGNSDFVDSFTFMSSLSRIDFHNYLISCRFKNYRFDTCKFLAQVYGISFIECDLENCEFVADEVVECSFNVNRLEKVVFKGSQISSCRFNTLTIGHLLADLKIREFNQNEETGQQYFGYYCSSCDILDYSTMLEFDPTVEFSTITMTFDVYRWFKARYEDKINSVEYFGHGHKVIINRNEKSQD